MNCLLMIRWPRSKCNRQQGAAVSSPPNENHDGGVDSAAPWKQKTAAVSNRRSSEAGMR